jgi:hypothetical protein
MRHAPAAGVANAIVTACWYDAINSAIASRATGCIQTDRLTYLKIGGARQYVNDGSDERRQVLMQLAARLVECIALADAHDEPLIGARLADTLEIVAERLARRSH